MCPGHLIAYREHRKAVQPPSKGKRKVVLATNFAETGITLIDVAFFIDSRKVKLKDKGSANHLSYLWPQKMP